MRRMAGPISRGKHRVSWATRTTNSSASSRSSLSPVMGRGSVPSPSNLDDTVESPSRTSHTQQNTLFFSPSGNRLVDDSPLPVSASEDGVPKHELGPAYVHTDGLVHQSAPAELGASRQKMFSFSPGVKRFSFDQAFQTTGSPPHEDFKLDPEAPIRAMRSTVSGDLDQGSSGRLQAVAEEEEKGDDDNIHADAPHPEVVRDGNVGVDVKEGAREDWGESFKIEWLSTEKLPFTRTRHIRNPWNHDREVKVSRDGTELEPSVGKKLLEEWGRLIEEQITAAPVTEQVAPLSRRASKSAPSSVAVTPAMVADAELPIL
ncbi:hypothetical protein H0H81_010840 [Sphagnurus paluster]|uniref:YTH domain-containing protein n=1 Tax=Sphagnurus paluster TaxID=117069 RepID=A0A9P7GPA5_9AGAR|nr:hypothetical protein H0H81_010840 [Sphagnurus paluster]